MYLKSCNSDYIKINNNIISNIIINLIHRLYCKNIRHRNLIMISINKEAKKQNIKIYNNDKKYRSINTWITTVFGSCDIFFNKFIKFNTNYNIKKDLQLV